LRREEPVGPPFGSVFLLMPLDGRRSTVDGRIFWASIVFLLTVDMLFLNGSTVNRKPEPHVVECMLIVWFSLSLGLGIF
jgi:hypothetical protein